MFGRDNIMAKDPPIICLARHGETAWTISGQHKPSTTMGIYAHEIPGTGTAAKAWDELEKQKSALPGTTFRKN
jgi:hypothetical protein